MMIVTRKSHTRKMVMRKKGFIIVMKIICKGNFFYGEDGNEYK